VSCEGKGPTPFQAQCSVCCRIFGGVGGFDKHRYYGQCRDPEPLGYVERDGVWREPMDHEKVEAFKKRVGR
jgi:hypothetical protein